MCSKSFLRNLGHGHRSPPAQEQISKAMTMCVVSLLRGVLGHGLRVFLSHPLSKAHTAQHLGRHHINAATPSFIYNPGRLPLPMKTSCQWISRHEGLIDMVMGRVCRYWSYWGRCSYSAFLLAWAVDLLVVDVVAQVIWKECLTCSDWARGWALGCSHEARGYWWLVIHSFKMPLDLWFALVKPQLLLFCPDTCRKGIGGVWADVANGFKPQPINPCSTDCAP